MKRKGEIDKSELDKLTAEIETWQRLFAQLDRQPEPSAD